MVDPELIGEAAIEGTEAAEVLMDGSVLVFLCVLAATLIMNHTLGHKLRLKYVTEAGAVIVVGAVLGGIVILSTHGEAKEWLANSISPTVFFIGFLPPIIFNSGYTLKRKVFLYYFVPSVLYAVVGTIITTVFIGLSLYGLGQAGVSLNMSLPECLAFGALITSTDSVAILSIFERLKVDPLVFYLCFGESVLSDAVVLVLYKIFTKFIGAEITWASMGHGCLDFLICLVGSMAIGFLFGCISALVFKHVDLRHTIYEMGVYFLLAYIPSLFSDVISLSGIVTILFTAVFLQLGFSVFSTQLSSLQPSFIFWTLILVLVGRAINIYPMSWVINRCTSLNIPRNIQHMLWFAGLRGAMAYVCAKGFPNIYDNQAAVEATTMVIVLVTVFFFGTFTISALEFLKIRMGIQASDVVNLSANQSKLLALETRYLLPFLHRKLHLRRERHAPQAVEGEFEEGEEEEEEDEGGGGQSVGERGTGSMGTTSKSFMQNELIGGLFQRESMTALDSGAGATAGSSGCGPGRGYSSHVLGSKSSVGGESECGIVGGGNPGNSKSKAEMSGEDMGEGDGDKEEDEGGLSARVV